MSQITPPLSQSVGYGVVVGLGLSFAAGEFHYIHQLRVIYTDSNDARDQVVEVSHRRG
ncbi:unnamed protein product [Penicillium salamii]|nr:unnamed protein product [Penicillium salamii]